MLTAAMAGADFLYSCRSGIRLRALVISLVYRHSLKLNAAARTGVRCVVVVVPGACSTMQWFLVSRSAQGLGMSLKWYLRVLDGKPPLGSVTLIKTYVHWSCACSNGQIVTLLANDSQKFYELMPLANLVWAAPLQIGIATYFLILFLGVFRRLLKSSLSSPRHAPQCQPPFVTACHYFTDAALPCAFAII